MSKAFDKETISELQKIRRANNAILGCAQILSEHGINKECMPHKLGAWLQLTPQQACGLQYAIETCARFTDDLFTDYLENLGVYWDNEHPPKVRKEAQATAEMINGDITYAEFERRLSECDAETAH